MIKFRCLAFLAALFFITPVLHSQQYQLNGNAQSVSCNCYTLTNAFNFQSGSAWNKILFNLNNPFDFRFSVNLGCKDNDGADGIAFLLQQVSTSLGASGGGMGFDGLSPSIGILLDTWQNLEDNDPVYDHISIQANGVISHGTDLAGPVPASATSNNIEDCNWHIFRVTWDPATHWLRAYFDGALRVEAQMDLVANIFNNNPMVYWGFTSATGGYNNLQQFCTALAPMFITNFTNNATCFGNPVTFTNNSESFAPITAYYWDFGDGVTSTLENPPPHIYAAPGLYTVKLAVKGFDGCDSDTLRSIIAIGDMPVADFDVFDTCAGLPPRIIERSAVNIGTVSEWEWRLNGNPVSNAQQPQLNGLTAGTYTLSLVSKSNYGCASASVQKQFTILPAPVIQASALADVCINVPVSFTATQTDNTTTIDVWNWEFGDGTVSTQPDNSYTYPVKGNYTAVAAATGTNGCVSNTVSIPITVHEAVAFAGNDTVFVKDQPFQLNGSGGGTYTWTPATGLSDPSIPNPTGVLQDDITYTLSIITAEGCVDDDAINITIFKGSNVFVPSGFTPNGDGKNETLMPYLVGIKTLDNFTVYNRWGEPVFATKTVGAGWDGRHKGTRQPTGVYVWRLRAVDYVGKVYELSGTTTLIR